MTVPFADRPPTAAELERFRLVLSTYQDGSGMLQNGSTTLPGWRDFERSLAVAFGGVAQESKAIFDVLIPNPQIRNANTGISCKMRAEFNRFAKDGRATLEISNSSGKFWTHLETLGLNQTNYKAQPQVVGDALLQVVHSWHEATSITRGGVVDLTRSYYVSLMYSLGGNYQMHQFSLDWPRPIRWYFKTKNGVAGRSLRGDDASGTVLEWYGESGGQLKYYPLIANALWASPVFQLEPLTEGEYGMLKKAEAYFPAKWPK